MAPKEIKTQIELIADSARSAGQYVEINPYLPTVLVYRGPDDEYFFQEHEASELLDKAETVSNEYEVSQEDYILWSAQGW